MGCLFALLRALSSFTVVLMPCSNLSHGLQEPFFMVGEEKQKRRDVVRVSYCSPCVCTFGVDAAHEGICTRLPPIGRGETQPPSFFFCLNRFVQPLCGEKGQVVQMERGPRWAAVQH